MSEVDTNVASLDDDSPRPASTGPMTDDELYAVGLDILKKGPDKRKFLRTFSQRTGKSQMQLRDIADRIWEENKGTRRTNAIIVLGFGAVMFVVGIFLAFSLEVTPIISGLPIVFGLYFAGQGLFTFLQLRRE